MRNNFLFICLLLLFSCKKDITGNLKDNQPPETYTVADTIIRSGEDRFNSQVKIFWWGNDPDGYIIGYEYTFDSIITATTDWKFITSQDSIFQLTTPPGKDTVDFTFFVRAIDNMLIPDPTPASLKYPVKNSPPTVTFVPGVHNPVKTYPALGFYWEGADPDGAENLSHYELYWNDTTIQPLILNSTVTSATFVATDISQNTTSTQIYPNNLTTPITETLAGLKLNDYNRLYIRAVDKSNAKSTFAITDSVFIKKPQSGILLINGYKNTSQRVSAQNFYALRMQNAGFAPYDTLFLYEQDVSGSYTQLSPNNFTQSKIFDFFETIIWYSDDAAASLSLAQLTTQNFFDQAGKLFMAVYVSSAFDEQSNFLDFTPVKSLVIPQDTILTFTDTSEVIPADNAWPVLLSTANLAVIRPFYLSTGAEKMYDAEITARKSGQPTTFPWQGQSAVIAKKKDASGNTNFVISTLELQKLNGNSNADQFFDKLLKEEFGL